MYLSNSYKNSSELYDLLYQRYLKSVPDFVKIVKKNTPQNGLILDLAAGTGEISIPLLKNGLQVTSLDLSGGMLNELGKKAKRIGVRNYRLCVADMGKINYKQQFDTVCIRQAINYFIGTKALQKGLNKIFEALKQGGKFIFNTPNYKGENKYPIVYNLYTKDHLNAFVLEINKINDRLLKHQQHSLIWSNNKRPKFVIDENSFYMFTKKEFHDALEKAGFPKIEFSGSNKTLYCVATK